MNKKSELLERWIRTTTLTVIAALVLFTEPLSAGWIRDGNDPNNGQPRRMIQVVFGINNGTVNNHPAGIPFQQFQENNVRADMRNLMPVINQVTHIEFWTSNNPATQPFHNQLALEGLAGALENSYNAAIANLLMAGIMQQPVLPNVTFSIHVK